VAHFLGQKHNEKLNITSAICSNYLNVFPCFTTLSSFLLVALCSEGRQTGHDSGCHLYNKLAQEQHTVSPIWHRFHCQCRVSVIQTVSKAQVELILVCPYALLAVTWRQQVAALQLVCGRSVSATSENWPNKDWLRWKAS